MFPLLKNGSRIINLTSEVARYTPQPFQGYYNISKVALDQYNDVLRRECNYLGIKVIKVQSGSMSTPLLKTANNEFDEMVTNSAHFKAPLTKFKYMMDRELKKTNNPDIIAKLVIKILKKKNPKIRYRKKNSFALSFMGHLPEKMQDGIYKKVIK
jgi:short-subunit dehydrogenase